jgi:hypothetical protein
LGLFQNAAQGAGRKIVARLAGNRHPSRFGGVLELAMATGGFDQVPSIRRQELEDF